MDRFRAGNGPGSVQKQSVQKTSVLWICSVAVNVSRKSPWIASTPFWIASRYTYGHSQLSPVHTCLNFSLVIKLNLFEGVTLAVINISRWLYAFSYSTDSSLGKEI